MESIAQARFELGSHDWQELMEFALKMSIVLRLS